MSQSKTVARRHALAMVRRAVAAGTATAEQLARWEDELGSEVRAIAKAAGTKKSTKKTATKKAPTDKGAGTSEE